VLIYGEQAAPLPLTFSVLCLVAGVQLSATETRPD
jgi:hypothetical protein